MLAALKQMQLEKKQQAEASDLKLRKYEKLTTKLVPVVGGLFALTALVALLSKSSTARNQMHGT
jgi:hypothetical protein